jgi:hypothetical protein
VSIGPRYFLPIAIFIAVSSCLGCNGWQLQRGWRPAASGAVTSKISTSSDTAPVQVTPTAKTGHIGGLVPEEDWTPGAQPHDHAPSVDEEKWQVWVGPVTDLTNNRATLGATVSCGSSEPPSLIVFSFSPDPEFTSGTRNFTRRVTCESGVQRLQAYVLGLPEPGVRMYFRAVLTGPAGSMRSATASFVVPAQ